MQDYTELCGGIPASSLAARPRPSRMKAGSDRFAMDRIEFPIYYRLLDMLIDLDCRLHL